MSVEKQIKNKIQDCFDPVHLEVINESDKHIGHAGHDGTGESHFKLIIVSDVFDGHGRVQRQRLVNKALSEVFEAGLHALSLRLYTPSEYL